MNEILDNTYDQDIIKCECTPKVVPGDKQFSKLASNNSAQQKSRPHLPVASCRRRIPTKVVLTTWIDLQRAFDKVWTDGLKVNLMRNGVCGALLRWINLYLHNRRARFSYNQAYNRKFLLWHDVPQGGVLSPWHSSWFSSMIWWPCVMVQRRACQHTSTATYRMQGTIDTPTAWDNDWCVTINKEKSSTTMFHLVGRHDQDGRYSSEKEDGAAYMWVTFDSGQIWKPHINHVDRIAFRILSIMCKLARPTWVQMSKYWKPYTRAQ